MISYFYKDRGNWILASSFEFLLSKNIMAMRCMNCNKGIMFGHNVSHAKNRTNRAFKPNLHAVRIKVGPHYKKMKLCTKCLRMVKKSVKEVPAAKSENMSVKPSA